MRRGWIAAVMLLATAVAACDDDMMEPETPLDPDTAPRAVIDRFSDEAGTLFRRSATSSLPAADAAIDFDQAPFITQGLGPDGRVVRYYNFDVMPEAPAPIFVLFHEGATSPVAGQINIVDVIPGDAGYSDFWRVVRVTVPTDYVANTATSLAELQAEGYAMEELDAIVNCPIVPEGSTAAEGAGADGLTRGWYRDQVVFYFDFDEASLTATAAGNVPTSPIFVTFNVDPDQAGGGPASGFMTQGSSDQTHNVVATLPGDAGYSPFWAVMPYTNAAFDDVHDLASAQAAMGFGLAALVNCPIVFEGDPPANPETADAVVIDRFSDQAGTLFRRSANAALPAAGAAIDFDTGPFVTQGLTPTGGVTRYYNFDVMSTTPAPIYALFHEDGSAVPGQLNIVDVVPGDAGYNDFWRVVRVTVPDGYVANSASSLQELMDAGYDMETTDILVNCPIVPDGSTATERLGGEDAGLTTGWYRGQLVHYFNFSEAALAPTAGDEVPVSPIYVTFNVNPDEEGGGPPSGFVTEAGTEQTHNVLGTVPGDAAYSPLWAVFPYDNASFDAVMDLATAQAAPSFGFAANVNCPVVLITP